MFPLIEASKCCNAFVCSMWRYELSNLNLKSIVAKRYVNLLVVTKIAFSRVGKYCVLQKKLKK